MILSFRSSKSQGLDHCNRCGECCKHPCLLASMDEVRAIAKYTNVDMKDIRLMAEKRVDGRILVSTELGPDGWCTYYAGSGVCSIHEVKPSGGKDFECWSDKADESRKSLFAWTEEQFEELTK